MEHFSIIRCYLRVRHILLSSILCVITVYCCYFGYHIFLDDLSLSTQLCIALLLVLLLFLFIFILLYPNASAPIDREWYRSIARDSIHIPNGLVEDLKSALDKAASEGRSGIRYQIPSSFEVSAPVLMSFLALYGFRVRPAKNQADSIVIIWS